MKPKPKVYLLPETKFDLKDIDKLYRKCQERRRLARKIVLPRQLPTRKAT